jgi:hypothetical protein
LNILIALYNSAYEDISGNATDEYMAIFAQKTMQFVRAPDENVFIPRKFLLLVKTWCQLIPTLAFNLIEILGLVVPFEWWLSRKHYAKLNDIVMGIIYSPLLVITAWIETRQADAIKWNRRHGEEDENDTQEWEHVAEEVDFDLDDNWKEEVKQNTPDIRVDPCTVEVRELKEQVAVLTELVKKLSEKKVVDGLS